MCCTVQDAPVDAVAMATPRPDCTASPLHYTIVFHDATGFDAAPQVNSPNRNRNIH